MYILYRN